MWVWINIPCSRVTYRHQLLKWFVDRNILWLNLSKTGNVSTFHFWPIIHTPIHRIEARGATDREWNRQQTTAAVEMRWKWGGNNQRNEWQNSTPSAWIQWQSFWKTFRRNRISFVTSNGCQQPDVSSCTTHSQFECHIYTAATHRHTEWLRKGVPQNENECRSESGPGKAVHTFHWFEKRYNHSYGWFESGHEYFEQRSRIRPKVSRWRVVLLILSSDCFLVPRFWSMNRSKQC